MAKEKKKKFIFRFSESPSRAAGRPISFSAHLVCGSFLLFIPCSCHCFGDFDEKNSAGRSLARGAGSSALGALGRALVSTGFVCRVNSRRPGAGREREDWSLPFLVCILGRAQAWTGLILAQARRSKPPEPSPNIDVLASDEVRVSYTEGQGWRSAAEAGWAGEEESVSWPFLPPKAFC